MRRIFITLTILLTFIISTAFLSDWKLHDDLRAQYSKPIGAWPKPTIDSGIAWQEFSSLQAADSSYFSVMAKAEVNLGKMLFFDPLLSGSNQISCSSCHDPESSWADKRAVALGNDHLQGNRNTLSLINVYARKSLFWDGRAASLEEQAKSPVAAHHEMAMNPDSIQYKLAKIESYRKLFKKAFGDDQINFERVAYSLAAFQRTITSKRSRFDQFLDGKHDALSDEEIHGLHLFRTKARCMNCHYGKFFTDEHFHNIGLTYYKRKYEDLGRYLITKDAEDVGRFRTPSLRDVMHNSPWMHNGLFKNITGVINIYNSGMHMIDPKPEQKEADPLYPVTDPLLKQLKLSKEEIQAVVAFLESITASQYHMRRPTLPR